MEHIENITKRNVAIDLSTSTLISIFMDSISGLGTAISDHQNATGLKIFINMSMYI